MKRPVQILLALGFGIFIGVGLIYYDIEPGPFLLPNLAVFVVLAYVNIFLHEYGHAFAAKIVGVGVKKIMIGTGRQIARFRLLGVPIVITNRFNAGLTFPASFDGPSLRARFFAVYAGGAVLQIFAIGACFIFFGFDPRRFFLGTGFDIAGAFIVSNLIMVLIALLPFHFSVMGVKMPTDGLRMLTIATSGTTGIDELRAINVVYDAMDHFEKKDYETAAELLGQCVVRFPDEPISQLNLAVALIKTLKLEEARSIMIALAADDKAKKYRAIIYNNIAWVGLIKGDEASMVEADTYSKMAFDLNKLMPAVLATRACVLIELGHVEEGIKLLKKQVNPRRTIDERTNNAVGFLFMAYGLIKKGDRTAAQLYLEKLGSYYEKLDADERYLFDRIREKTEGLDGLLEMNYGTEVSSPT